MCIHACVCGLCNLSPLSILLHTKKACIQAIAFITYLILFLFLFSLFARFYMCNDIACTPLYRIHTILLICMHCISMASVDVIFRMMTGRKHIIHFICRMSKQLNQLIILDRIHNYITDQQTTCDLHRVAWLKLSAYHLSWSCPCP